MNYYKFGSLSSDIFDLLMTGTHYLNPILTAELVKTGKN